MPTRPPAVTAITPQQSLFQLSQRSLSTSPRRLRKKRVNQCAPKSSHKIKKNKRDGLINANTSYFENLDMEALSSRGGSAGGVPPLLRLLVSGCGGKLVLRLNVHPLTFFLGCCNEGSEGGKLRAAAFQQGR